MYPSTVYYTLENHVLMYLCTCTLHIIYSCTYIVYYAIMYMYMYIISNCNRIHTYSKLIMFIKGKDG